MCQIPIRREALCVALHLRQYQELLAVRLFRSNSTSSGNARRVHWGMRDGIYDAHEVHPRKEQAPILQLRQLNERRKELATICRDNLVYRPNYVLDVGVRHGGK